MRVTFEVDQIRLFDALRSARGDASVIAAEVMGAMMTGRVTYRDAIRLELYGVRFIEATRGVEEKEIDR